MTVSHETKRLWRRLAIICVVGLVVAAALAVVGLKMRREAAQRQRIAANESAAVAALGSVAAAEQLYLEARGEYGTFPQLVEAGVFQAPLEGDRLASQGYAFTLSVTPRAEGRAPSFALNADPALDSGEEATGRRHFFAGSDVTGIRFAEGRPATATDTLLQTRDR